MIDTTAKHDTPRCKSRDAMLMTITNLIEDKSYRHIVQITPLIALLLTWDT